MPSRNLGEINSGLAQPGNAAGRRLSGLTVRANDLLGGREAVLAVRLIVLRDANCVFLQMRKFSLPFPSPCLATDCLTVVEMPAKWS